MILLCLMAREFLFPFIVFLFQLFQFFLMLEHFVTLSCHFVILVLLFPPMNPLSLAQIGAKQVKQ